MEILNFVNNYIVGFVLLISVLVFVHELGHYLFAKLFKVKVESFSIGFGKELFGWNDKSGTRWKFSLLPFGGYVKMKGELLPSKDEQLDEDSFGAKKLWQKALIVFAGPLFNLIFPIFILLFVAFFAGVANTPAKINNVLPSGASYKILKPMDTILQIDNTQINNFEDMQFYVAQNPNKNVTIKLLRDGKIMETKLTIGEEKRGSKNVGLLGVSVDQSSLVFVKYSFADSLSYSYKIYTRVLSAITLGLIDLFSGNVNSDDLGGPIKIAQISGDTFKQGVESWLFFMAMLSLNLAIINLFPIPALDGGHLLLYLIQGITRRELNPKLQNILMQSGFFLLMGLMVFVLLKDILSFFK